jgi:prevent-host-death family protein
VTPGPGTGRLKSARSPDRHRFRPPEKAPAGVRPLGRAQVVAAPARILHLTDAVAFVLPCVCMRTVGLRELRQEASDLVRQVENGEEIEITVSGRPAARMIPPAPKRWQRWDHIADLFTGRADPNWTSDVELVDQSVANPWERSG